MMRGIAFSLSFITLLLPTSGRPDRVSPAYAAPSLILLLITKIRLELREKPKTFYRFNQGRFQFLNGIERPGGPDSGDPSDPVNIFRLWNWR
jgi:hypothetical protein